MSTLNTKQGQKVDEKTGELRPVKIAAAETFMPSDDTTAIVKLALKDTVKHARLNQKHEEGDVRALTLATFELLKERTEARAVAELTILQADLYRLSGVDPKALGTHRAKVGMRVTRATRSAIMAFDRPGFRLTKIGDLECWEKHNTPEKNKEDTFGHVIGKVKNQSKDWEPVAQPSIGDHYGVQYPGSVNTKGTNKAKTEAATAASLVSSYESMTAEYLVATLSGANAKGKPPKAENLPVAILKRAVEIMTALNHYRDIAHDAGHDGPVQLFAAAIETAKDKDPASVDLSQTG
jgi:hypothetical protein